MSVSKVIMNSPQRRFSTANLFAKPEASAFAMLVIVLLGFELWTGIFLSPMNGKILLTVIPELGIVALGVTVLMIAGEFDLSVGSVFALTPMLMQVLSVYYDINIWVSIIVALAIAVLIGYVNGAVTIGLRIPSFIATLGMLFVARSIAIVVVGGTPRPMSPDTPTAFFAYDFGMFRSSLLWYIALLAVVGYVLHRTNAGNWLFATGGQPQAAKDLGINTRRVKLSAFMLCSFLAGLAGIIQVMRTRAPLPSIGGGLELEAIAAAVIGGTALTGGVGSVIGCLIGTILIRSIDNGLVMSRVSAEWFRTALGVMIVLSVVLNVYVQRFAVHGRHKES